ncbi:hypothetical protein Q0M94_28445 (plasmid) [Deinococcus radiomollis]|uniref:hypothetical protein n=1 Tax=Deinococcus radiomollis TaxID=468916 RepID=UPI00389121D7
MITPTQNAVSSTAPARKPAAVPAERCACCNRALPSGHGTRVEFIGVLGPECIKKFSSLIVALRDVDGLEAHEDDQGSIRLAHHVIWSLRRAGVAVKVVESRPGVSAVQIVGIARKAAAVIQSWEEMRAEFERRLKLAAAEREAQSWVAA